ncbi:MAG: methylated-DNA--[protein]-cysteine S-methyltransferase [Rhodospirillales bacterium]|nr:methylated-DNA--[protein]-cysteine S-methyltransferase [Rhodospirillales bacterium]
MNAFRLDIMAETIDYLVAHYREQPDLEFLARRAGYESTHFQKIFKESVGISPKRLIQYMNARHARSLLRGGHSLLDSALSSGLSGTARLHDLFVSCEGMTPGQVKNRGAGLEIVYGFHPTVLGEILIAKTKLGVCWLGFLVEESRDVPLARMMAFWPAAGFIHDDDAVQGEAEQVLAIWRGQGNRSKKLKLDLYGTNFQLQVWQALLRIPCGETVTYRDIAAEVCTEKASRAVGNAVGANPVSLLIPCHRVIRASGIIDNYAWGSPRKKLILALEADVCAGEEERSEIEDVPHGIKSRLLA